MEIACIIQARMGSTRLPGKVLFKLDKINTVLDYLVQQIGYCKKVKKIIIATTSLKEDDVIEEFAKKHNLACFRGSAHNVLDRYYQCAKQFSLSTIVRITADNPLIDPVIIDKVVTRFNLNSYDYISNSLVRSFPYGTDVEVFSFTSLEKVWHEAKEHEDREHVTSYFYKNFEKFKLSNVNNKENVSRLRYTIDEYDDFILVKKIIDKIKKRPILMNDIIALVKQEPELISINNNIKHRHIIKKDSIALRDIK